MHGIPPQEDFDVQYDSGARFKCGLGKDTLNCKSNCYYVLIRLFVFREIRQQQSVAILRQQLTTIQLLGTNLGTTSFVLCSHLSLISKLSYLHSHTLCRPNPTPAPQSPI